MCILVNSNYDLFDNDKILALALASFLSPRSIFLTAYKAFVLEYLTEYLKLNC